MHAYIFLTTMHAIYIYIYSERVTKPMKESTCKIAHRDGVCFQALLLTCCQAGGLHDLTRRPWMHGMDTCCHGYS